MLAAFLIPAGGQVRAISFFKIEGAFWLGESPACGGAGGGQLFSRRRRAIAER